MPPVPEKTKLPPLAPALPITGGVGEETTSFTTPVVLVSSLQMKPGGVDAKVNAPNVIAVALLNKV